MRRAKGNRILADRVRVRRSHAASAVLFIFASSPGWLYPARVLSGVSAGLMIGAATAALTEMLQPAGSRRSSLAATSDARRVADSRTISVSAAVAVPIIRPADTPDRTLAG